MKFQNIIFLCKYKIAFLVVVTSINCFSQSYFSNHTKWDYLPQTIFVEYQYSNTHSLKSGVEFCVNKYCKNKIFIGIGYGVALQNDKLLGLPNTHISYNQEKGFMTKISISNTNATLMGGVTFLNLLDLGVGYTYPIQKSEPVQLKGFTIGLTARLSKNNAIYGKLKLF